ncbi:MAG: hypothetical protein DHS20C14_09860 [Phycisphaeraceae bacterium]|nr:MAG: hypothetical protein DHS20C14_09860 [Phycisphaeraceae bacterium]
MTHRLSVLAGLVVGLGWSAGGVNAQDDVRLERLNRFIEGEGEPATNDLTRVWELSVAGAGYPTQSRLDVEGNLVVITTPGIGGSVRKYKVFGNGDGGSVDGGVPVSAWPGPALVSGVPLSLAVDYDGFIYVGQSDLGRHGYVQKLAASGGVIWDSPLIDLGTAPSSEEYYGVKELEVTDDGVPVGIATTEAIGGDTRAVVFQIDPFIGGYRWETPIDGYRCDDLLVSRDGQHLYFSAQHTNGPVSVFKLRLADGSIVPGWPRGTGGSHTRNAITEAPNGDIVVVAGSFGGSGSPTYTRFDASEDFASATRTYSGVSNGEFTDCAVARDGSVFLAGRGGNANEAQKFFAKYTADDTLAWFYDAPSNDDYDGDILPFTGPFVELDFCGDAYGLSLAGNGDSWAAKFDGEAGLSADNPEITTFAHSPSFSHIRPSGLLVDPGLNVYAIGANASDQHVDPGDLLVLKFQQPNPYMPTSAMACPNFTVENRSVWAPGTGSIDLSESYAVLPPELQNIGFDFGGEVDTFLFGSFGGGIDFNVNFNPRVGYRAYADGGTADLHAPVDVTWHVPAQISVFANTGVTVTSEYAVNPSARLTTCVKPDFDAGLTGSLDAGVYIRAFATLFSQNVLNQALIDEAVQIVEDFLPYLSVGWWLGTGDLLGDDAQWITKEDPFGLFKVEVRVPQLEQQAVYDAGTGEFSAVARDRFFISSANITEIIMALIPDSVPLPPTSVGEEFCSNGFCFSFCARIIQYYLLLNMEFVQDVTVSDLDPWVRYDFSDGRAAVVQRLSDDLSFQMPETSSEIIITPTVFMRTKMDNLTCLDFIPGQRFELLGAGVSAGYKSWTLFDASICLGCFENDFPSLGQVTIFDADAWDLNLPLGVNTTTGENGICLAPFVVTGIEPDEPELVGLSRGSLGLILYDQTQPTVTNFNLVANRSSKLLLYGDNLLPTSSPDASKVMISLQGVTEELPSTWLNLNTMLVEIPNRFRLVPGVARVWVENTNGCSPTVDLPIEYPVPFLDTVNPNLWAADPDLLDLPVAVLDGLTPLHTDSFIARRDYWIKMRNDLWNTSTTADLDGTTLANLDTDNDGVVEAHEYFVEFDFNQLPAFPAVHFGGAALARFGQPVDNGIYNARLRQDNYDLPRIVPVVVCNPGPGGGMSLAKDLAIAAPAPFAQSVEPAQVEPGGAGIPFSDDGTFELAVFGPAHVPYMPGFEEEKRGNFNRDSVVWFGGTYDAGANEMVGGIPLETDFVHSGSLRARVPLPFIQHAANVEIRVFTPANGTEYFEEIRDDTDGDGDPDDIVFQGFVPSGGASSPIVLEVDFFEPVLLGLGSPEIEARNPVFDLVSIDPNLPYFNFTVLGEYFRDGAIVLVDGTPRETMFVSREVLRCKLLPSDVRTAGAREISVLNPGLNGDTTDTRDLLIVPRTDERPMNLGAKGVGP